MKSIRNSARRLMLAGGLVLMLPLTASAACPPDDAPDGGRPGRHHGAGGPPPMPGDPGAFEEGPLPPHLLGLNLRQAQRDRIFAVLQAQAPAMRAKSREARQARAELHEMAMSAEYDEVMANRLAAVQAKALTELALLRSRADHEILQVLTPEQRKEFDELKCRFEPRGTPERRGSQLPPNG